MQEICSLGQEISLLKKKNNANLCTEEETTLLREKQKRQEQLEKKLKEKKQNLERQSKFRQNRKRNLNEILTENPNLKERLHVREKVTPYNLKKYKITQLQSCFLLYCNKIFVYSLQIGRPSLNEFQPGLLQAIIDIAMHGASTDERRQTETLRTIKTLDDLGEALKKQGFEISRSGLYLRLIPRKATSIQGKRHVITVPVKLAKAQAESHKSHVDSRFASSTIFHLEQIASLLGPNYVLFISQDDKGKVPIGITAANKQAPLLMHVEYRVSLPDHDWVVAPSHKLIPSVYAGIKIEEQGMGKNNAVTYSGPTYISIRSGKHCSSTALSHALDFERVLNLDTFDTITKNESGSIKPIAIIIVDGGPDENPRYTKVIDSAIHHF